VARTPRSSDLPVETSEGPALVHLTEPSGPRRGRLVLGHGAGGGVQAPDLQAVRSAAVAAGWAVALVVQPWKVAGRKVATAPPRLDAAWRDVLAALVAGQLAGPSPLVLGGRSAGARVACRTAGELGAAAVCCLAFPLHPPGRPERSRAAELPDDLPVLVVQGRRDPFGGPEDVAAAAPASVRVEAVDGDHGMKASAARAGELVTQWLAEIR
jgi:predicted alpha/beta-hydrolase family hydrolase